MYLDEREYMIKQGISDEKNQPNVFVPDRTRLRATRVWDVTSIIEATDGGPMGGIRGLLSPWSGIGGHDCLSCSNHTEGCRDCILCSTAGDVTTASDEVAAPRCSSGI
jgi:hypothetical protein